MKTTLVRLRYAGRGRSIRLARVPLFLRFVLTGTDWATLDALDQLDDQVRPGEHVIPARRVDRQRIHIDKRTLDGRHVAEWHDTAEYEPVDCCLTQAQLADATAWREWCEQAALVEHKEPTA